MPILSKELRSHYERELHSRYGNLLAVLRARELASSAEGAGEGHWRYPDQMCATVGSSLDISLAVEDFRGILAEIKKLK
jgi:hypothetical protein